jgi:hypothetical protein
MSSWGTEEEMDIINKLSLKQLILEHTHIYKYGIKCKSYKIRYDEKQLLSHVCPSTTQFQSKNYLLFLVLFHAHINALVLTCAHIV